MYLKKTVSNTTVNLVNNSECHGILAFYIIYNVLVSFFILTRSIDKKQSNHLCISSSVVFANFKTCLLATDRSKAVVLV